MMNPEDEGADPLPHGTLFAACYDGEHPEKRQAMLDAITEADIVLGRNTKTGDEVPYYGIAQMKRVVRRNEPEVANVLKVDIDPDTDDVEVLCAFVKVAKGAHCYEAFCEPTK
jgi:hypothetical protein